MSSRELHLQGQAHAPHGPEGVHQHRHLIARHRFEQQRRAPGLADPVGDFGDVRYGLTGSLMRTNSPAFSSRAINSCKFR